MRLHRALAFSVLGAPIIALLWLRLIDGIPLTRWDLAGAVLALAGMSVIA